MSEDCHTWKDATTPQHLDFRLSGCLLSTWALIIMMRLSRYCSQCCSCLFSGCILVGECHFSTGFCFSLKLRGVISIVPPLKQLQNLFVERVTGTLVSNLNCTVFCIFIHQAPHEMRERFVYRMQSETLNNVTSNEQLQSWRGLKQNKNIAKIVSHIKELREVFSHRRSCFIPAHWGKGKLHINKLLLVELELFYQNRKGPVDVVQTK